MPGDNGFFPPAQYSPWWTLLGIALIVLVVAWYIVVPRLTRAAPIISDAAARAAQAPIVRARFVEAINDVGLRYERAELSSRQAHQQLSTLVRAFAHESSGYPASAMTLSELRQLELPGLTAAVERFYPAEFGTSGAGSVPAAVNDARRVVLEWSSLP